MITTAEKLREQGLEQGRRDVLLRQIRLRFGGLTEEYVTRLVRHGALGAVASSTALSFCRDTAPSRPSLNPTLDPVFLSL